MTDSSNYESNYNAFGIANPVPFTNSPGSNSGIVYNPSQTPIAMGATSLTQYRKNITFFALDGGSVEIGTLDASIGAVPNGGAGIMILDPNGNEVFVISDSNPVALAISSQPGRDTPIPLVEISDASLQEDVALSIGIGNASDGLDITGDGTGQGIGITQSGSGLGMNIEITGSGNGVEVEVTGAGDPATFEINNPASTTWPLILGNNAVKFSHFITMIFLQNIGIFVSDGTTPNGVLTGNQGDLCLNSSSTGQLAYCKGGTVWSIIT